MLVKNKLFAILFTAFSIACATLLSGCPAITAMEDAKQAPPTTQFTAKHAPNQTYTMAVQAMGALGKIVSQDRESGMVQGQKGNWVLSVTITPAGKGSHVDVSARYVPSNQMDFNSREGLTSQYVQLLESKLSEKLTPAS